MSVIILHWRIKMHCRVRWHFTCICIACSTVLLTVIVQLSVKAYKTTFRLHGVKDIKCKLFLIWSSLYYDAAKKGRKYIFEDRKTELNLHWNIICITFHFSAITSDMYFCTHIAKWAEMKLFAQYVCLERLLVYRSKVSWMTIISFRGSSDGKSGGRIPRS